MKMSEIGSFYGGLSGKSKKDFDHGDAKYITYMNVYSNIAVNIATAETVDVSIGEKQNAIQYGDILFTGSSETPDECGMTSVVTENTAESIYLNSFCFGFRPDNVTIFNVHFLKHLFRSDTLRKQIIKTANGVTRFNVSKKKMLNVLVPIPSMETQNHIASTLDRFELLTTDLQSGLPAEIAARRQQYEYYRERLLTFKRKVA
jgi:type I restriction enzyme S subunit